MIHLLRLWLRVGGGIDLFNQKKQNMADVNMAFENQENKNVESKMCDVKKNHLS